MRGRLLGLLVAGWLSAPAAALATPVLMMSHTGRVTVHQDRFLSPAAVTPEPLGRMPAMPRGAAADPRPAARVARERSVRSELHRLYRTHQISADAYRTYLRSFNRAVAAESRLSGIRSSELIAVVENLHQIAARDLLTPSRLPALFLTLDRNLQWWSNGPVPASGDRIEFAGSQLVWQYYPGQGLELQVLGTFGKADGLYTAGPARYHDLSALLGEMIPLAAARSSGPAWEYYFHFDGGAPPWTSGMAQGTAIEALTRAYQALGHDASYLQLAHQALGLFSAAPPRGVKIATPLGARYLQYSFAPGVDIINAFLQSLIGLYDYAHTSGDAQAQALFAAGSAQAQAELPRFDTGAWSLYQPGIEDSLDYHNLVTGFLDQLCTRTQASAYCVTARHFHSYLKSPPALALLTSKARPRRGFELRFRLSKHSHVGVVVLRGSQTLFATSADFSYGVGSFAIPPLRAGEYTVHLAATDLAGNFSRIVEPLRVTRHRQST